MKANAWLAITAAGIAGLAIWASQKAAAARSARTALVVLSQDRARLDGKLDEAGQRLAVADEAHARAKTALEALQKSAGPAPAAPKSQATAPRRSLSITELIRHEPDAEVLFLAAQRSELAVRYGPLCRQLGLSTEQAAAFQDNYIGRVEARMDLADVVRTQGKSASGGAVEALEREAETAYASKQRALLGESGYQQLQDYDRTSSIRGMVGAIAGAAVLEQAPFTPDQADRLVRAIANASESYRRGGVVNSADVDWEIVDQQARTILSPAQFAVFNSMDPGPTRAGLLQTRMYSLVARATAAERAAAASSGSKPPVP